MILFGPSGTGDRFKAEGFKSSEQAGKWIKDNGLDLFEYSFGRGVNLKEETAETLGKVFKENDVKLSVHAPYFINLANPDEEKAENSFRYIIESCKMAKIMGADRVIFHPASQGKESREEALSRTKLRFLRLAEIMREENLTDITLCPETMGKLAQIGDVKEVVDLCKTDDIYLPTIDFGHINAREQGSLKSVDDFVEKMNYMINELGYERVKNFHVHFSKIQYSAKGEVRHLNFDDEVYGPKYEPFIDALIKLNLKPHVICESAGNQTDDSIEMKNYYLSKINEEGLLR